eukprot:superscaffoldBa00008415_g23330
MNSRLFSSVYECTTARELRPAPNVERTSASANRRRQRLSSDQWRVRSGGPSLPAHRGPEGGRCEVRAVGRRVV